MGNANDMKDDELLEKVHNKNGNCIVKVEGFFYLF